MPTGEAREYQATIPAATPSSAPVTISLNMPPRIVQRVDWRVPPGNQGTLGWRLTMGKVQVLPHIVQPWVIGEGIRGTWQVEGLPDSGAWEVTGYNTGSHPHAVYVVFHVLVPEKAPALRQLTPHDQLGPLPDISQLPAGSISPRWPFSPLGRPVLP